jgi:hypothetical protein
MIYFALLQHDANRNIRNILRYNVPLLSATFRGAGRPLTRNITLPNGSTLGRAYDYDDQTGNFGASPACALPSATRSSPDPPSFFERTPAKSR